MLLLVFLPVVQADAEVNLNLSSSFFFSEPVDTLRVAVHHFPRDTQFTKVSLYHQGVPLSDGTNLTFFYENIKHGNYVITSNVLVKDSFVPVRSVLPYVPDVNNPDVQPTDIINSNNDMVSGLASHIVNVDDDYYTRIFKTATWVNQHISYNLTTLTADASRSASWVIENGYGVCDEITVTFIALLRAQSIPARYVSGVTYYNGTFTNHGWAEVYFPSYGWIPFDVTFGQFGWLDDTHIPMQFSHDALDPSISYSWESSHASQIRTTGLSTTGSFIDLSNFTFPVGVNLSLLSPLIRSNSYNVLFINLTNPESYYIPLEIPLYHTPQMHFVEKSPLHVLLEPGETRVVPLLFSVDDLSEEYVYYLPISILNHEIRQQVSARGDRHTPEKLRQEYFPHENGFMCTLEQDFIYLYEKSQIICSVDYDEYTICYDDSCVSGTQKGIYHFTYVPNSLGWKNITLHLHTPSHDEKQDLVLEVRDMPLFVVEPSPVSNITYPNNFTLNFTLRNYGDTQVKGIFIVGFNSITEEFNLTDEREQEMSIRFPGSDFVDANNTISYMLDYYDMHDRLYQTSGDMVIPVVFPDGVLTSKALFRKSLYWIEDHALVSIMIISLLTFILVLSLLRITIFGKRDD